MHPIRPERGVTLIELVLAMVIVGIIVAAVVFFLSPLRQSTDLALRAELSDIADNALQRIGRDVKLALPNSVRTATVGGSVYVEFIAVRTAGRYRSDGGGPVIAGNCPTDGSGVPDRDQLVFDSADTCFTTMGKLPGTVATGADQLVLNNYGFTDQDAYQTAGTLNRVVISSIDVTHADRDKIEYGSATFQRALHDSPGKRFFVVSGRVTYRCDMTAGTITRHDGYGWPAGQPTGVALGAGSMIAEHVLALTGCSFDYANVGPQLGLLTMRVTLQRQLSGGANETVSLYHAVHVNNAP
jgi:MSHA biogenesis protein MshO